VSKVTQRLIGWVAAIALAAVALAPTMMTVPSWWPVGGPLRLGLDLRGGTYLLYGVDLDEAVRQSLRSAAREIELSLRDAQVGAFTVDVEGDAIVVRAADRGRLSEIRGLVETRFPDVTGRDVSGGSELSLRLDERARLHIRNNAVEQALQILRNRIDEFGVAEPTGWIDLIGVDPAYRARGVARALLDRFVRGGQELRAISTVATLIDLAQADVREFFVGAGFRPGPMVQLQRDLGIGPGGPRAI